MRENLLSVRWRNVYGNVGSGMCLLVLGVSLYLKSIDGIGLVSAVMLLLCASTALYACVSRDAEEMDEMALADEGKAAAFAAKVGLTLVGLAAAFGILLKTQIDLSALSCAFIGVALVGYGLAFAWLERC